MTPALRLLLIRKWSALLGPAALTTGKAPLVGPGVDVNARRTT